MTNLKTLKNFNDNDRFLSLCIYKFPLGKCGGVTDEDDVKTIYVLNEEGNHKFKDIEDKRLVFYPEQRGEEYWAIKPMVAPVDMHGPMSGGNLAYSSDSRCKRVYHVHDRFETDETFNAMNN